MHHRRQPWPRKCAPRHYGPAGAITGATPGAAASALSASTQATNPAWIDFDPFCRVGRARPDLGANSPPRAGGRRQRRPISFAHCHVRVPALPDWHVGSAATWGLPPPRDPRMIGRMFKLTLASLAVLVYFAGCSSQSANSAPATQPTAEKSDVEVEFKEPPEATESATPEPEKAKPEETKTESPAAETNTKTNSGKKSCKGLDKTTCQITQGCLWSTNKSCIAE
jgi:hypothetical protein